jgi:hypothetical protein
MDYRGMKPLKAWQLRACESVFLALTTLLCVFLTRNLLAALYNDFKNDVGVTAVLGRPPEVWQILIICLPVAALIGMNIPHHSRKVTLDTPGSS